MNISWWNDKKLLHCIHLNHVNTTNHSYDCLQIHYNTLNVWEKNLILHMFTAAHNVNLFFTCTKSSCGGSSWWLGKGSVVSGINTNFTSTLHIPFLIWAPWYISLLSSLETIALLAICLLFIRNIESPIPNYKTWNWENEYQCKWIKYLHSSIWIWNQHFNVPHKDLQQNRSPIVCQRHLLSMAKMLVISSRSKSSKFSSSYFLWLLGICHPYRP